MRPPIFLWEPNDLLAFDSAERAEAFVEPPDVQAGVVFDADGRLLAFETDGRRTFLRERESEPRHEQELRDALAQATLAVGQTVDPAAPLQELVADGRLELVLAFPVFDVGSGPREHDVLVLDVLGKDLSGVEVLDDLAAVH